VGPVHPLPRTGCGSRVAWVGSVINHPGPTKQALAERWCVRTFISVRGRVRSRDCVAARAVRRARSGCAHRAPVRSQNHSPSVSIVTWWTDVLGDDLPFLRFALLRCGLHRLFFGVAGGVASLRGIKSDQADVGLLVVDADSVSVEN